MMRYSALSLVSLLLLMSGNAYALQEGRWFGGISTGMSITDLSRGDWDDGSLISGSVDNAGLSYGVFAGYGFSRRWGIEVDYWRIADTDFSGVSSSRFPSVWIPGPVVGKSHAQSVNMAGVVAWPATSRLSLLAKGGLMFWNTTTKYFPTVTSQITLENDQTTRINDNGTSLLYGIGAEYRLRGPWHVRAEWTRGSVGLARTTEVTVDYLSLGLLVYLR